MGLLGVFPFVLIAWAGLSIILKINNGEIDEAKADAKFIIIIALISLVVRLLIYFKT